MPADAPRLAVLIPDPELPEPWRWAFDVEADALEAAGARVDPIAWTEFGERDGYDAVLPLVAWGYNRRYGEWLALLDRLESAAVPVFNPVPLLRWNTDKAYLAELAALGVPTVPTVECASLDRADLAKARDRFNVERLVIKPPVSAGADGTYVLAPGDEIPATAAGRRTMIQPWVESITREGEYSLILFDGMASHCVVKRPPSGEFRVQPQFGGTTDACRCPEGAEALARAALAVAPAETAYARVDMVVGNDGALQIIELELIEPALFLDHSPDQGRAFAEAILSAAKRAAEQPLPDR